MAAVATLCAAASAKAQDPAPGPNVIGKVTTVTGVPVAGIEVSVDGTNLKTRTDTRGSFAFVGAPAGTQELVLRGIGYMPARKPIRVPERSMDITVQMLSAPSILDTVKVQERINVLSGIVVDEHDQPVAGATIEVISGEKKTVTTGEDGWFILTSVREGVTVFRTRKPGYYAVNTAVPMHEWRGVVVHIETLDDKLSSLRKADASGEAPIAQAAWKDTEMRMSMKGSRAVIISEEELAPFADFSLGEAIRHTKAGATLAFDLQNAQGQICVLLDGRRAVGSTTLDGWRAADVEMVELYPPGSEASGTAARYLRTAGCRNSPNPGMRSRGPFYAVLWMR